MKNLKKIGIIVLILVLLIISGVEGFYILKDKNIEGKCDENKIETIYKGYEYLVENIDNKLADFIKISDKAIIDKGHTLLLSLTSDKDVINSEMVIEYYDENNELVEKDEQSIGILLKNNKFVVKSNIPELDDRYSGKIVITMDSSEFDTTDYVYLDKNNLTFETTTNTNPNTNELIVNIKGVNSFSNKIINLSGYALLYNNGKITNAAYFTNNMDIEVGNNINLDTIIYPLSENDKITYDKIEVVVNYLY